ncbi:MAG: hypothetical protein A2496_05600 [Burkholderiales bacterium RIFOXYC12_FULL_60_6]|nr:MAG: hypothetical protein A2496_05600 [Burkholderiales bacterium RIFOXYC12_FULL_60_6]
MNRCHPALKGLSLGLMSLLVCFVTLAPEPLAAQGLVRQFPAAAKRGTLQVTQPPNILINGQAERLSPGARIKSTNNLIVLSGSLIGQAVLVNYQRDPQGQIHEVWLLNPAEAQQKRAGMEPVTNFVFGSDADKPKTDDGKTPFDQLPKFNPGQ